MRSINKNRSPFLDKIVNANNDAVFPVAVAVPIGFFAYGKFRDQKYESETGFLLGAAEVVSLGVGFGLKHLFRRDRPFAKLMDVRYPVDERNDRSSFPSGHAIGAFAIATSLSLRYPEPYLYLPLHFWAMFVAYGRVYLGVHYPSDVLAGAVLGSGTAIAVHVLEPDILKLKRKILGGADNDEGGGGGAEIRLVPLQGGASLLFTYKL